MMDLWPDDIGTPSVKTPVSILKEQASALGKKTNNVVEGQVDEVARPFGVTLDELAFGFYIVAPILKNYRYRLFTIAHKLDLYPLRISVDSSINNDIKQTQPGLDRDVFGFIVVGTEREFLEVLGFIFKSPKTIKVIHALLAQSES